jgi:phosphoglycerol transferase MdoB-like AlkP superfamily enzyme
MYRGASDEVFFSTAEQYLDALLREEEPLYVNLITMSSHAPFNGVPRDRRPLQLPGELENSRAGRFLGALSYTDAAVGDFVTWLKETGQWDTSIVVLYGDHTALKDLELDGANKEIAEELLGRPYSAVDRQRIAMMVHLPGQVQGGVINSTVGQVDIAPTIADLLGENISEMPHLGRSMFVDSDPLVITRAYFPAGSFINSGVAFMPKMSFEDGAAIDVVEGSPRTAGFQERDDFKRVAELSALSDEWIRSCPPRANVGDIKDAFIPTVKLESE